MLMKPTRARIFFAEYDVMKSAASTLKVAYSNRVRAASTEGDRQWWVSRRRALRDYVAGAVDTDREDLINRTRVMRDELHHIGGLTVSSSV